MYAPPTQFWHTFSSSSTHAVARIQVFPYATWGAFFFLLPVGLLADSLGPLPVILCGLVAREATRLLLLFGEGGCAI